MRATLITIIAVAALSSPSRPLAGEAKATASPGAITFSFKLDPRLSGPTYGGERWVSPRTFRGASAQDSVEVRAVALDARGRSLRISPRWTASDPELLEVAPASGARVTITARRAGEGTVAVRSGEATRILAVKVAGASGSWQVSISQ
jgi:hypothetical protein